MIRKNILFKLLFIICILLLNNNYLEITNYSNTIISNNDYYMKINIPSINLSRYLYEYNSKNNNINKNIIILDKSNAPDIVNGNLILAAHSGNSNKAFFNNLIKLKEKDKISILFKGKEYIYEFNNKYEINKTGKAEIIRDYNKNTLTMITCSQTNKKKQIVFISYLIEIKNVENN